MDECLDKCYIFHDKSKVLILLSLRYIAIPIEEVLLGIYIMVSILLWYNDQYYNVL